MIVLHEVVADAEVGKLIRAVGLAEKAALIREDRRLEQFGAVQAGAENLEGHVGQIRRTACEQASRPVGGVPSPGGRRGRHRHP